MKMINWDDSRNVYDGQTLKAEILNLYNSINNTEYQIAEQDCQRRTRNNSTNSNACKIGIHFMRTFKNEPQEPHIDYPWKSVKNTNKKKMKPVIAFAPLENDGLMINLWLDKANSVGSIENNCRDNTKRLFPYKLMLRAGQIAFIDGDVIHGGGLTPSGKRCHVYMCSPDDYAIKKNEHHKDGVPASEFSDMKHEKLIPLIDYSEYDNLWVQDKLNAQLVEP